MKPVTPLNALAQISGRTGDKPQMLFNRDLIGLRYVEQLLLYKLSNITTEGGKQLPREVWDKIIELAWPQEFKPFCFAQAIALRRCSKAELLQCREVFVQRLQPYPTRFGAFIHREDVNEFEEFARTPTQFSSSMNELYKDFHREIDELMAMHPEEEHTPASEYDDEDPFEIYFTPIDDDLPRDYTCLFADLTVPDVIAWEEDGNCAACMASSLLEDGSEHWQSYRYICPACSNRECPICGGPCLPCGVQVPCPLCIGVDISDEHEAFFAKYKDDSAPEEEETALADRLRQRMNQLGYEMWEDTAPCRGSARFEQPGL
jgi:hypothetical protein